MHLPAASLVHVQMRQPGCRRTLFTIGARASRTCTSQVKLPGLPFLQAAQRHERSLTRARALKLIGAVAGWVVLSVMAWPTTSLAAVSCVPQAVSGITQFFETLPGVSCNIPSPRPGAKHRAHTRRGSGVAGVGGSSGAGTTGGSGGTGTTGGLGDTGTPGGSGTAGGSGATGTMGEAGGPRGAATAGASGTGGIRSATARRLSDQGATGAAVLQLVAQTGTAPAGRGPGHRRRPDTVAGANAHPPPLSGGSGRGLLGGLIHPLLASSRHGGAGALLPLLLALTVVTIVVVRVAGPRRRA